MIFKKNYIIYELPNKLKKKSLFIGEIKDCDYCNNRGVCIMTEDDNKFCR